MKAAPAAPFSFGAIVGADDVLLPLHGFGFEARAALGASRGRPAGRRLPGHRPRLHPLCRERAAAAAALAHGTPDQRVHGAQARRPGFRRLPAARKQTVRRVVPHRRPLGSHGRGLCPQPLQSAGHPERAGGRGALQPLLPPHADGAAWSRAADARADGLAVLDEGPGRVAVREGFRRHRAAVAGPRHAAVDDARDVPSRLGRGDEARGARRRGAYRRQASRSTSGATRPAGRWRCCMRWILWTTLPCGGRTACSCCRPPSS